MEKAWSVLVAAQPYSQSSPKFSALIGIQLASDTLLLRTRQLGLERLYRVHGRATLCSL